MVTMADSALFVDTNILIYANIIEAPQHAAALAAVERAEELGRVLWISRQVLREYLVIMTRPQVFKMLSRGVVLDQVRHFLDRFEIAEDSPAVTEQLLALIANTTIGGKQVHDANIVATMKAYGISSLLTYNTADFERFSREIQLESIVPA